jgi:hypothetical protein
MFEAIAGGHVAVCVVTAHDPCVLPATCCLCLTGNSGGPLLDSSGRLIGVVSGLQAMQSALEAVCAQVWGCAAAVLQLRCDALAVLMHTCADRY